ncbi:hypothetical protein SY88_22240 [Clostridiales bacterium PH28_bin88]|nr:hypothetical protein SY88_22240 [Clostridiales bacterium PH28_bin88]
MTEFVRFLNGEKACYGVVRGEQVIALSGSIFTQWQETDEVFPSSAVRLLAPCEPSKVICIGLNYRDHAEEMKIPIPEKPVVFMKPSTAVVGPGERVIKPAMCRRLDYEAELGVVIGRVTRHAEPGNAIENVLGYVCGNDVTARDLQPKDGQWTVAKSFDTFCPLGPRIVSGIDPSDLEVKAFLNGQERQRSTTAQLIFPVEYLVSYLSKVMTLLPGDVILTGTPSGVGPMEPGDEIAIEIRHLGRLVNRVAAE